MMMNTINITNQNYFYLTDKETLYKWTDLKGRDCGVPLRVPLSPHGRKRKSWN